MTSQRFRSLFVLRTQTLLLYKSTYHALLNQDKKPFWSKSSSVIICWFSLRVPLNASYKRLSICSKSHLKLRTVLVQWSVWGNSWSWINNTHQEYMHKIHFIFNTKCSTLFAYIGKYRFLEKMRHIKMKKLNSFQFSLPLLFIYSLYIFKIAVGGFYNVQTKFLNKLHWQL